MKKTMKKLKTFLLCLIALCPLTAFSSPAYRGGSDVGGGMGVVCKTPEGRVASVELLDLWEARVIFGRNIVISNEPVSKQIDLALDQLMNSRYTQGFAILPKGIYGSQAFRIMLGDNANMFLSPDWPTIHRLRGVTLAKTFDSFEVVTPRDCEIAQIVRYQDTVTGPFILVNQDLVEKMDATNLAALYVHEAYYALLRGSPGGNWGEKSSLRVRRAVGLAFSGYKFTPLEKFLPDDYYSCGDDNNQAFVYMAPVEDSSGRKVMRTTFQLVSVAGLNMIDFREPDRYELSTIDEIIHRPFPENWGSGNYMPFSASVGFDFEVYFNFGSDGLGNPQAKFQLLRAPDQLAPLTEVTVNCHLVSTEK